MNDDFQWIRDIKMETHLDFPESWSDNEVSRKDSRRLKHLLYNTNKPPFTPIEEVRTNLNEQHQPELAEIFYICERLGIELSDLSVIWNQQKQFKKRMQDNGMRDALGRYKTPTKEGRDNKGVYVGGGGSNCCKIRYPKKNRSRRVWKKFYKMFPRAAEWDGWDGKTSKRMK